MKKQGHLLVTNQVDHSSLWRHFWIQIGCILPDFMVRSLIKGHKIEVAGERIFAMMKELDQVGNWSLASCVKLGYVLHYVEDFFTFAHNRQYQGSIREHIEYEKLQYRRFATLFLQKEMSRPIDASELLHQRCMYIENLQDWILGKHVEYSQSIGGIENDYHYMVSAVKMVFWHYERAFASNRINRGWNRIPRLITSLFARN